MATHYQTEIAKLLLEVLEPTEKGVCVKITPKPEGRNLFPTFDDARTANQAFIIQEELENTFGKNTVTMSHGFDHRKIMIMAKDGRDPHSLVNEVVQSVKDIAEKKHVVEAGKTIRTENGAAFVDGILDGYRNGKIEYHQGFARILADETLTAQARREAFNALREEEKRLGRGKDGFN